MEGLDDEEEQNGRYIVNLVGSSSLIHFSEILFCFDVNFAVFV